jgi:hypothetical protein
MPFRLRYLAHDLELPVGEFVVGRSTDCQLSLDDPLVSRRHAVLRVRKDGVSVQDLGSRNGVLVNGTKINGERELAAGDKVGIGSQEMVLHMAAEAHPTAAAGSEEVYRRATQTLGAAFVGDLRAAVDAVVGQPKPAQIADPPTAEASRSVQSFMLLGGVADKALALGKAEDAERILHVLLTDVITRARDGNVVDPGVMEPAARYAARLAGATGKASWVEYCFELYRRQKRVLPASVIDELYGAVRKVKNLESAAIRSYLEALREGHAGFGPAERFLFQRIEGLERQVSSK